MDARKNAIFAFQFAKPILQSITHLIRSWNTIHGFRDSVLVYKMHDDDTQKFRALPFLPIKRSSDYNEQTR